jgi:rubredoxin
MANLLVSVLTMRCPVCRKGHVFRESNPYNLNRVGEMHHLCPVCGQNFRPEPGFYFGAAIVSYPMMVLFCIVVTVLFYLIVGDIFNHIASLLILAILLSVAVMPLSFRYSRIIWLHIVFKHKVKSK